MKVIARKKKKRKSRYKVNLQKHMFLWLSNDLFPFKQLAVANYNHRLRPIK